MAKRKYEDVLKDVPRLPELESQREKVEELKRALAEDPNFIPLRASRLAVLYSEIREQKEQIQEQLSAVQVRLDAVTSLLIDCMDVEGITSLQLETGRSVSTWPEPYANIVDRDAFREWCLAEGLGRSMTLHPSTISALVKQRLLSGEPEPPGVKVYSKDVIRLTGG